MSRTLGILGFFLAMVSLGACSSTCGDRSTASDHEVEVYKPSPGETRADI